MNPEERLSQVEHDIKVIRRELEQFKFEVMEIVGSACSMEPLMALIKEAIEKRERIILELHEKINRISSN